VSLLEASGCPEVASYADETRTHSALQNSDTDYKTLDRSASNAAILVMR
jgi:hypothetical protein